MNSHKTSSFKKFLKELDEETGTADIASVDSKLDTSVMKRLHKGKRCRLHKEYNCEDCLEETWD